MHLKLTTLHTIKLLLLLLTRPFSTSSSSSACRDQCGTIPINYPFGIDEGCGAPQLNSMLSCNTSTQALFFVTPNGNYKIQSIDYESQTLTVYDPDMSTCTILQPHHDLRLSDIQYAIIPPSPDTVFALLNCSLDSPILHRYSNLCFDVADHKCDELYNACSSFRVFTTPGLLNPGAGAGGAGGAGVNFNNNNNTGPNGYFYAGGGGNYNDNNNNNVNNASESVGAPPCCFTGYSTMKVMSMDILDCTHYTSFYDSDKVRGVSPMDWSYGLKFSYSVPDMGCHRCAKSGGTCGFDADTQALMCLCSATLNSTRQCGVGTDMDAGEHRIPLNIIQALIICLAVLFFLH